MKIYRVKHFDSYYSEYNVYYNEYFYNCEMAIAKVQDLLKRLCKIETVRIHENGGYMTCKYEEWDQSFDGDLIEIALDDSEVIFFERINVNMTDNGINLF